MHCTPSEADPQEYGPYAGESGKGYYAVGGTPARAGWPPPVASSGWRRGGGPKPRDMAGDSAFTDSGGRDVDR